MTTGHPHFHLNNRPSHPMTPHSQNFSTFLYAIFILAGCSSPPSDHIADASHRWQHSPASSNLPSSAVEVVPAISATNYFEEEAKSAALQKYNTDELLTGGLELNEINSIRAEFARGFVDAKTGRTPAKTDIPESWQFGPGGTIVDGPPVRASEGSGALSFGVSYNTYVKGWNEAKKSF